MTKMDFASRFKWPDYLVFTMSLLISAVIGIYYAWKSRRDSTTSGYLMGNRDMGILPVTASLMVSLVSAIGVIGVPAEAYTYGILILMWSIAFGVAIVIACIFYMPVYHRLQLTSMYEYLELRFDKRVRTMCSILCMIQFMLFSSVALYAPSIAISQVTGLSYWACILISAFLCTFYTTLGGFKTVLWTDTIQCIIMFVGLMATFGKGVVDVGGFGLILERAGASGRLDFGSLTPNLVRRHDMWVWIYGDIPFILSMYATGQFAVQRFCSVRSLNKARLALLGVIPIFTTFSVVSILTGFVAFAYYYGCDPLESGRIRSRDQIMPLLVLDVFSNNPGMPGLFLSSVMSAALSTLSSFQNSFAAVLLEDIVKPLKEYVTGRSMTDKQGTFVSKLLVFVIGIMILAIALGIAESGKLLFQLASSAFAIGAAPSLGVFTLGMFVPFANGKGALSGMVTGLTLLIWVIIGAMYVRVEDTPLPVSTEMCPNGNMSMFNTDLYNATAISVNNLITNSGSLLNMTTAEPTETVRTGVMLLYTLSFRLYCMLGALPTLIVGIIVSLATGGLEERKRLPPDVLFSWKVHARIFNLDDNESDLVKTDIENDKTPGMRERELEDIPSRRAKISESDDREVSKSLL